MTESPEIPTNPVLSPGFARAQRLSRILVVVLTIGIGLAILGFIAFTVYMASPDLRAVIAEHSRRPIPPVSWGKYIFHVLSGIPFLIAIGFARKLFARFAAGEVFTASTIGIMRSAALWLTVAGFLPLQPLTLIVGIATYVAAYVMAEACRIADDAAGIV